MTAYYNENDPFAAAWLRELIKADLIAKGEVDERSIEDVRPSDLRGYRQCHFFAGIGVWSYALRCAGWPDDRPVWTGSCPCQPFSAAGKRKGTADERHLWPSFYHLISNNKPVVVIGEQVASKDGLAWLDTVQTDLEAANYSFGAVDTCAAGFGAPHIRQRLYFVANTSSERRQQVSRSAPSDEETNGWESNGHYFPSSISAVGKLADTLSTRWTKGWTESGDRQASGSGSIGVVAHTNGGKSSNGDIQRSGEYGLGTEDGGTVVELGDSDESGSQGFEFGGNSSDQRTAGTTGVAHELAESKSQHDGSGNTGTGRRSEPSDRCQVNGFWQDAVWLYCRDEKYRPTKPGIFPLVDGPSVNRVGKLRGSGNALCAPQATAFIEAFLETQNA